MVASDIEKLNASNAQDPACRIKGLVKRFSEDHATLLATASHHQESTATMRLLMAQSPAFRWLDDLSAALEPHSEVTPDPDSVLVMVP